MALKTWHMLSNGMGSFDAEGLPLAVEMFGVEDIEALVDQLLTIKAFVNKPKNRD